MLPEDCNEKSRQPFLDHSAGFGPVPIFRGRRKRTVIQVRPQNIQVQHCYLPVSAHHFVSGILITDPAHALLPRYTYQRGLETERSRRKGELQFHSMHRDMQFLMPTQTDWKLDIANSRSCGFPDSAPPLRCIVTHPPLSDVRCKFLPMKRRVPLLPAVASKLAPPTPSIHLDWLARALLGAAGL